MKMNKQAKALILAIAALLAASLLFGCAGAGGTASAVTTTTAAATTTAATTTAEPVTTAATTAADAAGAEGGAGTDAGSSDWEYIKNKGELLIGITYYAPMNYLDDDGTLVGFETEFAVALCERLGVTPKFVEIDWSTKEIELAAKTIDCIWNGMTITADRAAQMDISQGYLHNRPVVIVREDKVDEYQTPDDVKGAYVIAEKGSMADEIAQTDEFFLQGTYTAVDTQVKAFMELSSGTADLAVGDYVMAIGSLGAGTDFENLVISPYKTFDAESYGIAVRKGSPETLNQINTTIDALLADGTLMKIAETYKLQDLLTTK